MRVIVLSFILLFSCNVFSMFSHTLEVTEADIQQQLNQLDASSYQDGFLSVDLQEPRIRLLESSDKITVQGIVKAVFLGNMQANADFAVNSKIRYQAKQGAFYLYDIELVSLKSEQIPDMYISSIKQVVGQLLNQVLDQQPVYQLKDNNVQERLAKATLKDVEIKKGKLLLTFSP